MTSKELPMFRVTRDQEVELELKMKESTKNSLEDYVAFLKELDDQEASPGEILDVLVPQALKKDKAFIQWCSKKD